MPHSNCTKVLRWWSYLPPWAPPACWDTSLKFHPLPLHEGFFSPSKVWTMCNCQTNVSLGFFVCLFVSFLTWKRRFQVRNKEIPCKNAVNRPQMWLTWALTCFCPTVAVESKKYKHRNKNELIWFLYFHIETGLYRVNVNQWCVSSSNLKKPSSGSPGVGRGHHRCLHLQASFKEHEGWCWRPSCWASSLSWWRWWVWGAPPSWQRNPSRRTKWLWQEGSSSSLPVSWLTSPKQNHACQWAAPPHCQWLWSKAACTLLTDEKMMKPLNVLPAWNNKRDAWFSRSACFSWNILVRSQDRAGILRPVYSHKRQVGSSPDSQMVHMKALTDTWTFIVISLPQKLWRF